LLIGLCFLLVFSMMLMSGCRKAPAGGAKLTFEFLFGQGEQGWSGDFTDLPVDFEEDIYELDFGLRELPAEVGPGKAYMITGHNRSDDLFMFLKRKLTQADGLKPNTTYRLVVELDLASDAPAGAVGIGGPPGEAVFVKVGAAGEEPLPVEENGEWRLNVDKGAQSEGGRNALVVGDVAKPTNEDFDVYEMKTLGNTEALEVATDAQGNLWVFVGTDSGFEGRTTLYYSRIHITLEEK
jgi:hypothetical protein